MAASITCPECAAVLKPPSSAAGRQVRCPRCGTVFRPRVAPRPAADDGVITATLMSDTPSRKPAPPHVGEEKDTPPVKRRNRGLVMAGTLVLVGVLWVLCAGGGLLGLLIYDHYRLVAGTEDLRARLREDAAHGPKAAEPAAPVRPADPPAGPPVPPAAPPAGPPVPPIQPVEGGAPADPGATSIPVGVLRDLKAATVFIKVEFGNAGATGSGFLIRADGDTGFVVTNHHVLTLTDEGGPGRFPFGPFPGLRPPNPFGPFPGMEPPNPFAPFPNAGQPTVTLVFSSGTPQEQSVRGEVVTDDAALDLAVLFFRGLRNPPRPIDPRQQPRLIETMPVFFFGFPFGQNLAINQGNPAITVGKGLVSSLGTDERGEVVRVQIEGDLNPGNSGGPVIDATGRLVGIARAKVLNTQIGWAIPAPQLTRMLTGKVFTFSVIPLKVENGTASIRVLALLADPLRQIRGVTLHYAPGNQGGNVGTLAGARALNLQVNGPRATGLVSLPVPDPANDVFSFQVAYVNGDGQTVLTAAQSMRVAHHGAAPPNPPPGAAPNPPPPPPAPPPPRVLTREELDQAIKDLAASDWVARKQAAELLAEAEPKERRDEVRKALEPLMNDSNLILRGAAAKALGVWGGKDSVPLLLASLKDSNVFLQEAVVEALGKTRDPRAAEPVAERLTNFPLREAAVEALKRIGPPAEKAVLKYLTHQDIFLRRDVCSILKEIGTRESIPALEELVNSKDLHISVQVAPAAREALEAIKARR
jgi:predicted Zn finger-like uncharacterized protein